jgi:hypothetical protein
MTMETPSAFELLELGQDRRILVEDQPLGDLELQALGPQPASASASLTVRWTPPAETGPARD